MGGLAVLFFIGLYLVIAFKVVKRFNESRYNWLVLALVVLIPSGDAVVGRVYLKYLCAKEGGLKVYRVAEHVEGFMDDVVGRGYWVKEHGYQFAEDMPVNGMVTRYSKQNGQIIRVDSLMPQSQYRVRLLHIGGVQNVYMRNQYVVENISGSDALALDTQIAFNGGWVERFLAQFSDAGGGSVAWCTNTEINPDVRYKNLVTSILKH